MSALEDEAERQRAALLRAERGHDAEIVRSYGAVLGRMREHLDALTTQIAEADDPSPGWLARQARYQALIDDLEQGLIDALARAGSTIAGAQREAAGLGAAHARDLTVLAPGPAPQAARDALAQTFNRVNTTALERLAGFASDGRPLGLLLAEIIPDGVQEVRDVLAYGVASGQSPRVIARSVSEAAHIPLTRALTIARTESLRAYRTASREQMQATDVVHEWTWHAAISERTCPVCLAMHGSVHPVDEILESHPACRCTMVPRTPSWADLGFDGIPDNRPAIETGPVLFDRMSEADKLAVMGRSKLDAYNAGRITLQDLVKPTVSPRWGRGLREASLADALAAH